MALVLRLAASMIVAACSVACQLTASVAAGDEIVDEASPGHQVRRLDARPSTGNDRAMAFDETDTMATLEGISIALNEVGDGGTYVWHRRDGRLSGMAQPHESFKSSAGLPCRHLTVTLSAFERSRRIDGIACRSDAGRWQLEG